MIKINNKFEIGEQVFIFRDGCIFHCRISGININVHSKEIMYSYTLTPYDIKFGGSFYNIDECEICSKLEDIVSIIPVR